METNNSKNTIIREHANPRPVHLQQRNNNARLHLPPAIKHPAPLLPPAPNFLLPLQLPPNNNPVLNALFIHRYIHTQILSKNINFGWVFAVFDTE